MINSNCPECHGTGWKRVESNGSRYVVRCDCSQAERTHQLFEHARIPRRYEHCAFENFDIRKHRETGQPNKSIEAARLCARTFTEEYPLDYGLLFVGPTGVGKTHLAVAVLRELITSKGVDCLFYDFRDLLKAIQDSYNSVSQTSELRVLQPVLDIEVLLLDEMGALSPSDWVKETLAYIINSRYNQKKVTLITTTIPRDADAGRRIVAPSGEAIPDFELTLAQLGSTLLSRLYEMCKLVEMSSDDVRKAIKRAR